MVLEFHLYGIGVVFTHKIVFAKTIEALEIVDIAWVVPLTPERLGILTNLLGVKCLVLNAIL